MMKTHHAGTADREAARSSCRMGNVETEEQAPATSHVAGWTPLRRRVVSGLLLLHVAALVIGPAAVAPASPLSQSAWHLFRPYLEAAYLNHGYHFFAPEPGPSHLVRYELELPDGTRQLGYFPNRDQHKPRLLYHRHFMLSEHLGNLVAEEAPPAIIEAYSVSFARHLLKEHGAKRIKLYIVRHSLPRPGDVAAGMPLDHASLYREKLLGTYEAGDS